MDGRVWKLEHQYLTTRPGGILAASMADIRETIAASKAAEIEFLLTDIDAAFVFLDRARLTRDDNTRQRCLQLARKAHDSVAGFAERPALQECDLTRVRERLAELKAAL